MQSINTTVLKKIDHSRTQWWPHLTRKQSLRQSGAGKYDPENRSDLSCSPPNITHALDTRARQSRGSVQSPGHLLREEYLRGQGLDVVWNGGSTDISAQYAGSSHGREECFPYLRKIWVRMRFRPTCTCSLPYVGWMWDWRKNILCLHTFGKFIGNPHETDLGLHAAEEM